jgi:hypothetical protein
MNWEIEGQVKGFWMDEKQGWVRRLHREWLAVMQTFGDGGDRQRGEKQSREDFGDTMRVAVVQKGLKDETLKGEDCLLLSAAASQDIGWSTEGFTRSGNTLPFGKEDCEKAVLYVSLDRYDIQLASKVIEWYGSHPEDSCSVTQDTDASSMGMAERKALNRDAAGVTDILQTSEIRGFVMEVKRQGQARAWHDRQVQLFPDSFAGGMKQRCGSGKERHLEVLAAGENPAG